MSLSGVRICDILVTGDFPQANRTVNHWLHMIRSMLKWLGYLLLFGIALLMIWGVWMRFRPPLAFLDKNQSITEVLQDSTYQVHLAEEDRLYRDVRLGTTTSDTIRCTVSLPPDVPEKGLPVLLILGGLEVGRQSLKYIPYHGKNILVAYQYPYSPVYWYRSSPLSQIPAIQSAALSVPSQITALHEWIRRQPWAGKNSVNLLGYSFGAMFLPAICHLSQEQSIQFGPVVIAYGGADLYRLFHTNLDFIEPVRSVVAVLMETVIYPLEPLLHLPHMSGEFFAVNGLYDDQIPEESWRLLHRHLPEPKTLRILQEGHMHPKRRELTLRLVRMSQEWLGDQGTINPIPQYREADTTEQSFTAETRSTFGFPKGE